MIFGHKWNLRKLCPFQLLQGNNVPSSDGIAERKLGRRLSILSRGSNYRSPGTLLVSEMIREKILKLTEQEVPHSVAVVIESMKRERRRRTRYIFNCHHHGGA